MIWAGVLAGSAGCFLLKLAGWSLPHRALDDRRVARVNALLPAALLLTLLVLQTIVDGRRLVADARLPALAVALVLVWRKAPFVVVVGAACATAAALRAVA